MDVTDLDNLSSTQLKVAMLFSAFDKDGDGVLSLSEFQTLGLSNRGEPQEMTSETFAQIIHIVQSALHEMEVAWVVAKGAVKLSSAGGGSDDGVKDNTGY